MNIIQLFQILLVNPIINALVAIYQGLLYIHVPYALGFAIILLTVLIRLILYPLTASQLKASKKMQTIAPHINKLKEKHKGDMQRIQKETMLLYKEHGVNPAAGCLPVLIQLPIIWALYGVLRNVINLQPKVTVSYINHIVYFNSIKLKHVWETNFLGLPIGQTPAHLLSHVGFLVLLIPVLTGLFQFIQSKMMFTQQPKAIATKKDQKKEPEMDFATAMQSQSLYIFPAMIAFFSYSFPLGLSLYWNTFTIFGIIQQYRIQGLGGLTGWIEKLQKRPTQVTIKK